MSLLSTLKSLFAPLPEGSIRYKGFTIAATPEEDSGLYRISGVISKKDQHHSFTLVDQVLVRDNCVQLTQQKAKLFIDRKGQNIFV
ncbi:HlyU family transcriptional regulator [Amphritea sp. HPY]|uniref:HlyU family transcriptional regulator n=1 Tax=Amphritea sp. HPY TaxID=3421652 RepID=UPI003D7F0C4E